MTADNLQPVMRARGITLGTLIERRPLTLCFRGVLSSDGTALFIKVLHSEISKVRDHFAREVGILHSLSGREGMPVLHASSAENPPLFHACTYLSARRLDQMIGGAEDSLPGILRIGGLLAQWIDQLHASGIAHRDLSPDHIFLGGDGCLTVVDFGMAKRTPTLSPEERLLCEGYDIQAVAMILWELICGRPLFHYRSDTLRTQLASEIKVVRSTSLPAPIAQLLMDGLGTKSELTPDGVMRGEPISGAEELLLRLQELRT